MQEFFQAVQGIALILILLGFGYLLATFGWVKKEDSEFLTRFVVTIALPPYMVVHLTTHFTRDTLLDLGKGLPVPVVSMFLTYLLGLGLAYVLRLPPTKRGIFVVAFSLSNTIFVGLPVCQALFGEKATPFVLLYYMVNTTFFWTLGALGIALSGNPRKHLPLPKTVLQCVLNPPFIAFFVGIALILLQCPLPGIALEAAKMVGSLTTPLSLLCVGTTVNLRHIRLNRDLLLVLLGRFSLAPLLVLLVARLFPLSALMRNVFFVMSAMPVMMQSSLLARLYHADYEYATGLIAATTALSALVIPLLKVWVVHL
ncbi:MAG: AEC family transporter [Candidatus Caldatribacterium sp.]|uniref:AEC family transporter n=1 Tax=Candidatus Caldatribacterium sp. TaxID=2282143 RepID=UPI0029993CA9|nr:AEC family transporter [Candidatus Caldatribacterium sp.]MCX7729974.1 AEC family transporter [Candidatus Caldatribacterium sp.]MDW8081922.1 AEC family transporter [Candidatus Calescibacterium sp.]